MKDIHRLYPIVSRAEGDSGRARAAQTRNYPGASATAQGSAVTGRPASTRSQQAAPASSSTTIGTNGAS